MWDSLASGWGKVKARVVSGKNWRGKERWRYVISREFAGVYDHDWRHGRWRDTEDQAREDGYRKMAELCDWPFTKENEIGR